MNSSASSPSSVLGIPVHAATYESALEVCKSLARSGRPAAVTACNTHLVAHGRHDRSFGNILRKFDLVLPDGMPLIWSLRMDGSDLPDRVYGPYFMRHVLKNCPRPWRHFFFGGKQETLDHLCEAARKLQPDLEIAGTLSPRFGKWTEEEEQEFARLISEARADFIWVALGGEKQERWIVQNLKRYQHGVFFGVGDAFELLAGNRPFAPEVLQKVGLTWAYRLYQEPRRLWKRYFKYNSLFLYYSIRDRIFPPPKPKTRPSISFVGCRGTPARYAGFETVVEQLGSRLASRGYEVEVFNRPHFYPDRPESHLGMKIHYVPTIPQKFLETIVHTFLSICQILFDPPSRRPQIAYLCGVGNAVMALPLRMVGVRVVANVDGLDFKREKWGLPAQLWLWMSEKLVPKFANVVIADNQTVLRHYRRSHGFSPRYLSYGADLAFRTESRKALDQFGLTPDGYLLMVGRLSRENAPDLALRAYALSKRRLPLVIVGGAGYERQYARELEQLSIPGVIFTGAVYGEGYRELSSHCRCFILPGTIEATRLVLLDQMACSNAIVFQHCEATREVIGAAGEPFGGNDPVASLAAGIDRMAEDSDYCRELGRMARQRIIKYYNWDVVTQKYDELFQSLVTLENPRGA